MAEFPTKLILVNVAFESSIKLIPPPDQDAVLLVTVQFSIVGDEDQQETPPPTEAALSVNVQFVKVGEEALQYIPPPLSPAELSVNVQFSKKGTEP